MSRWVVRRLLASLVTLFGITTITFLLARVVPSDPAVVYIGPLARPAEIARVTKQLGLDRPLYVQYVTYLQGLLKGDWGRSLATKEPVLGGIATRLPATLELIFVAMADRPRRSGSRSGSSPPAARAGPPTRASGSGRSSASRCPCSGSGCCSRCSMAQWLHLLPATSRISLETSVLHPIPKVTGFYLVRLARDRRLVRLPRRRRAHHPARDHARGLSGRPDHADDAGSMLDVLGQDYIRTARTFGLGERLVLWRLALRNAMPTTLTVSGLSLAYLITGSFFVEIVFDWPGIGQYATNALLNVDYPAIMGITLLGAFAFLTINFVVDLDPGEARPADQAAMSVTLDSPEQLPPAYRSTGGDVEPRLPACSGGERAAQVGGVDHRAPGLRRAGRADPRSLSGAGARSRRRPGARPRAELAAPVRHRPSRPGHPQPRHLRRPPGARRLPRRRRCSRC